MRLSGGPLAMRRENYTVEPQSFTAKEMAQAQSWTEEKARHVLEGFLERGIVERTGFDTYKLTSRGLVAGEKAGVVKPLDLSKSLPGAN